MRYGREDMLRFCGMRSRPALAIHPASSWKIAARSAICLRLDVLKPSALASSSALMALTLPVFSPANGAAVSIRRNISALGRLSHCPF